MLYTTLPRTSFDKTTYPNLEDRMNGGPIPIPYGHLENVIPVCVDVITKRQKFAGREIGAIDEIRNGGELLVAGSDYTTDLANAEFTLLSTPWLEPATLYYFVLEADYPVGGGHLSFKKCHTAGYAGGQAFIIDGAGVWTAQPAVDILFRLKGRAKLSGGSTNKVDTTYLGRGAGLPLRDAAARTRIAQSFTTGAKGFYATSISLWTTRKGAPPASLLRATILSAYLPAEVRVGARSVEIDVKVDERYWKYSLPFPLQTEDSDLRGDIRGVLKAGAVIYDGADMLWDLVVTEIGKASTIIDPAALADFKTKRAWEVAYNLDRTLTFGKILAKLERSLLFKFTPLQNQTHGPVVYEAVEPPNTPHLQDGDFKTFSMARRFSSVRARIKVKYDESPSDQDVFKLAELESQVAEFFYGVDSTLEVETYHKTAAGAAWLAGKLSSMYEMPPLEAKFEVWGYGLDLLPGRDKVHLTRIRACYAGGNLSGVLFRIERILKRPDTRSTEVVAVLDTQTY